MNLTTALVIASACFIFVDAFAHRGHAADGLKRHAAAAAFVQRTAENSKGNSDEVTEESGTFSEQDGNHAGDRISSKPNKSHSKSATDRHMNVLFFMVDDLRPNIGPYNFTLTTTPTMNFLAKKGLTFTRAYANYPWCAPSRNSFLSGRLPDTTRDFNFVDHFRERGIGENWRSLPQYFKELGYVTASSGKFFHKMKPPNNDYPFSWSLKPFSPYCKAPVECPDSLASFSSRAHEHAKCQQHGWSWCALAVDKDEDRDDYQLEDQRVASSCIRQLEEMVQHNGKKPFFLACGFYKPHAPWVFPAEFLQDFPKDIMQIPLAAAAAQDKPEGMPRAAFHGPMDMKNALDGGDNSTDLEMAKRYNRRAYYACVNYIDYLMGKVVNKLLDLNKMSSTVIVVTGDHGWHLGEQGVWGKMTNFENALRVPLIVRSPMHQESHGQVTDELAELVDLYPTLAQLAGLPHPKDEGEHVNGTSLLQVFENPHSKNRVKKYALSQVAKPSLKDPTLISVDQPRNGTEIMGYSLRSPLWRYTAWFKFDSMDQVPIYHDLLGQELYDHQEDGDPKHSAHGGFDSCQEMKNLASMPRYRGVVLDLHEELLRHISLKPVGGVERFYPEEGWILAMEVRDPNLHLLFPRHDQANSGSSNRNSSLFLEEQFVFVGSD